MESEAELLALAYDYEQATRHRSVPTLYQCGRQMPAKLALCRRR